MGAAVIAGSLRAIARASIPSLVKQGFGANAIIASLRHHGLGYRRTVMLGDIRTLSGLMKKEGAMMAFASTKLIPRGLMVESTYRSARRYLIRGKMTTVLEATGEEVTQVVSWFSNTLMTKDQWLDKFMAAYLERAYAPGVTIKHVEVASVEHKMGWGY